VTVIHSDAMTADAAATALLIAPTDQRATIAQQMGIKNLLIIDEQGTLHLSQTMAKRIQLLETPVPKTGELVIR
ncbi:MAG TPA: hypothetical protein HPP91_14755, partial [Gammaproteobacteria bacterium]|nr:hypothetical protein [Gammaproteobacteria bacterium]